jgi:hypothetical protein
MIASVLSLSGPHLSRVCALEAHCKLCKKRTGKMAVAQVAFLFIAEDGIATEAVWTAFFTAAAEMTLLHEIPPTRPQQRPRMFPRHLEIQCQEERLPWKRMESWDTRAHSQLSNLKPVSIPLITVEGNTHYVEIIYVSAVTRQHQKRCLQDPRVGLLVCCFLPYSICAFYCACLYNTFARSRFATLQKHERLLLCGRGYPAAAHSFRES